MTIKSIFTSNSAQFIVTFCVVYLLLSGIDEFFGDEWGMRVAFLLLGLVIGSWDKGKYR